MRFEIALVGGGLQSALIALAVLSRRPSTRIVMIERERTLGGNHLWSFHGDDVPEEARTFVEPLIVERWAGWDVAFPEVRRGFDIPYASVTSERLHNVIANTSCEIVHARASTISAHAVALDDGRTIEADLVVDARGPDPDAYSSAGFQKFLGVELSLKSPSKVTRPILMDANVPQTDGYRFMYVLPFNNMGDGRVMVEDTYFSNHRELDHERARAEILAYAERIGLQVDRIVREEHGALPLPLAMKFEPAAHGPLVAGYRGGYFHPTTGYSFPIAVRLAQHVAATFPNVFGAEFRAFTDRHARQLRFALLLNRLLFVATPEHHRRDVMERFHRLPEATVRHFYALTTTAADRARIVCGRPPRGVSIRAALAQMVNA